MPQSAGGKIAAIPQLYAENASLRRRAARSKVSLMLSADSGRWLLSLEHGELTGPIPARGPMDSTDLVLIAADPVWLGHWQPIPAPGFQDLFAMTKTGRMTIYGDFRPLMVNLQVIKDLIALPRSLP